MGVLMQEGLVQVYLHTSVFNGVKPTWGSTVSFLCKAKGVNISTQASKKDAGGGCGTTRNRYGKSTGTLRIDGLSQGLGHLFKSLGAVAPLKVPIMIRTSPNSSLAGYDQWEGVIEQWDWVMQDDEPTAENIVVDLTPDWD